MHSFFGGKESSRAARPDPDRVVRHSSGWTQMLKHLKSSEGLRVLDFGPTSSSNINMVTGLGHSIYMAHVVAEAGKPEWVTPPSSPGEDPVFDVEQFLMQNLNFSGRMFDVVLLWDTLEYLPKDLLTPVIARLHEVMAPGGLLLAFFHSKPDGPEATFSRYHMTESENVSMQRMGGSPLLHTFTNRQVEHLMHEFASYRFFLAKDALREVLVTR